MKRTNKKGFTIVELVIVIAVIAILAAVLIPTFASLVDKANRSADMQAVRQMNTALAVNEVTKGKDITQVRAALAENDIDIEDYHPLASNTYFFWDPESNRVVYTDKDYKVLFPEGYETADQNKWVSLSGEIPEKKVDILSDGKVEVKSAGELYYVMNNAASKNVTEITLSNDFNAMGASLSVENLNKSLTIKGTDAQNPVKIQNMTQLSAALTETTGETSLGKVYGSGFIQEIKGTKENIVEVTLENIVIDGATVGDLETGGVGALIGRVSGYAEVTIKNCTVQNTIVYGKNKVGGLIGSIAGTTQTVSENGSNVTKSTTIVKIEGCKLENVTVKCSEGQAATVIGCVYGNPTVTIDKAFGTDWVSGCSTELVETGRQTIDLKDKTLTAVSDVANNASGTTVAFGEGDCLVAEFSSSGAAEKTVKADYGKKDTDTWNEDWNSLLNLDKYRIYNKNAYMTILAGASTSAPENASNITIGGTAQTNSAVYGRVVKIDSETTQYYTNLQDAIK